MPATKIRNIRVSDDLWEASKAKAVDNGETLTDVVNRALAVYSGVSFTPEAKDYTSRTRAATAEATS